MSFASFRAALHWSRMLRKPLPPRARWWQCPAVVAHVNRIICGEPLTDRAAGAPVLIRRHFPGRTFRRGISVGCGTGSKEMALIESGLVETFDLYELSSARIRRGEQLANEKGLSGHVRFHRKDGMSVDAQEAFDLVYWSGALHHMTDTNKAMEWSRNALAPGGAFYMDDFVGPARMQWTPRILRHANRIRRVLRQRPVKRPHPLMVRLVDPTECADSSNILASVRRWFPDATVIPTGGVIYAVALQDILNEIPPDSDMLRRLLRLDEQCTRLGEYVHAAAIARK